MNALVDPEVIHALYEASTAGVEIDLIVRGVCCLKPGVPGASDRIRVISILGRFLEHSRAYCFGNDGQFEVNIGSADWMQRNFDRRIEVAVPIRDADQRETIRSVLELMLQDNRQAWDLGPDGCYTQRQPGDEPERGSHKTFLDKSRKPASEWKPGLSPSPDSRAQSTEHRAQSTAQGIVLCPLAFPVCSVPCALCSST